MIINIFEGFICPEQLWSGHHSQQCLVHNDERETIQSSAEEDNYLQLIFGNKLCSNTILGYCLLGGLVIMLLVCILLLAI